MRKPLPHPLAAAVSALLSLPLAERYGYGAVAVFALCLPIIDRMVRIGGISKPPKGDGLVLMLLTLSRLIRAMPPGKAFIHSCGRSLGNERSLKRAFLALREGGSIHSAMRRIAHASDGAWPALEAASQAISFDLRTSEERLRSYAKIREERRKARLDLDARLEAISLRFRLLSVIASASLAVSAFASPFLSHFFSQRAIQPVPGGMALMRFDAAPFLVFYSMALVFSYLPAKFLPYISGLKLSLCASASYFVTYLVLVITVGSGF